MGSITFVVALIAALISPIDDEVEFEIRGNVALGTRFLLAEIDPWLEDLRERPEDDGALDDAAHELAQLYRRNGFPRVQVFTDRRSVDMQRLIRFRIKEGPQRVVQAVRFIGNHHFDIDTLRDLFPWQRRGTLGTGAEIFADETVAAGVAGIRLLYRLEGYLDVEVETSTTEIESPDDITVALYVELTEGSQYKLAGIEIVGESEIPHSDMRDAAGVDSDTPFTPRLPLEVENRIERMLAERSYFGAEVTVTVRDEEGEEKTLIVDVQKGELWVIDDIVIEGSERTVPSWMLRRLPFTVGDPYRQSSIENGRRALFETGLFSKVTLDTTPMLGDLGRLRVTITVAEKDAIRPALRVGFGTYELGRLGAEVQHRNLFGRGWIGSLRGKVSFRGEEAETTLRYPFLFERKIALRLRVKYRRFEEVSFERQEVTTSTGLEIPWETELLGKMRTAVGYEIRDEQIHDPDVLLPPEFTEDTRSALLFSSIVRDNRDSLLLPTRGSRFHARAEFADEAFGSELDFIRLTGGYSHVWSPAEQWNIVAAARVGWIRALGANEIPLAERFFLGGSRTVRSFPEDELGPKDPGNDPIGGEAYVVGNLELRTPLWRALRGAIFYDTGSLVRREANIGRKDYRHAAGVGLFLVTPIGPLRVDFASNLNRESGEDPWAIHVLLGHPF